MACNLIYHLNSFLQKLDLTAFMYQHDTCTLKARSDDRKSFYPLVLPVPFLYLVHQLISGKLPSDHHDQVLNNILRTIHIQ